MNKQDAMEISKGLNTQNYRPEWVNKWESLLLRARAGDLAAHKELIELNHPLPTGTAYRSNDKACQWCGLYHVTGF